MASLVLLADYEIVAACITRRLPDGRRVRGERLRGRVGRIELDRGSAWRAGSFIWRSYTVIAGLAAAAVPRRRRLGFGGYWPRWAVPSASSSASAILPAADARAPALRRLDSLLVLAPAVGLVGRPLPQSRNVLSRSRRRPGTGATGPRGPRPRRWHDRRRTEGPMDAHSSGSSPTTTSAMSPTGPRRHPRPACECQAVETQLSYLRRIVQGRHDIVTGSWTGVAHGGDPADMSELGRSAAGDPRRPHPCPGIGPAASDHGARRAVGSPRGSPRGHRHREPSLDSPVDARRRRSSR